LPDANKELETTKDPMNTHLHTKDLKQDVTATLFRSRFTPPKNREKSNSTEDNFPVLEPVSEATSDFGCGQTSKRLYDVVFSFCGLVLLAPLFAVVAVLVKIADGGDVFYRQSRVGQGGREFLIYKFRTMTQAAEKVGPSVTKNGDVRITWIGRILRKTKLDELPQLWNVLKGDMSLVGPRPEVPRYVRYYNPEQRAMLRHRPGITDLASLCFRDEGALLANADNVEEFYIQHCIPRKLQLNQEYARRASLLSDTWIIIQTICPYWVGVLACYGIILTVAFWLSWELIYDFTPLDLTTIQFGRELALAVGFQLAFLTWQRQCRGLLSYYSFPDARKVVTALSLAAAGLVTCSLAANGRPPVNVILINAILSFCLLAGFRTLLRQWRERSARTEDIADNTPARIGIIGAGNTGARLALELSDNPKSGRQVVAFFDDDFHKWQKSIHDVPVAGMPECLLDGWAQKLDEVVIAIPDAQADRVREIKRLLCKTSLKCYTVTSPARFWERSQAA
jgi:lipopolysaccharide/colanic/teichoic acid biosynthesis glycosyltransferase